MSGSGHADPQRFALAAGGYRENRLTQKQVGEVLGLSRIKRKIVCPATPILATMSRTGFTREAESLKRYSKSCNLLNGGGFEHVPPRYLFVIGWADLMPEVPRPLGKPAWLSVKVAGGSESN